MKLRVPYFRQATDYTCGPATARMLLAYFRKPYGSEQSVANTMQTNADIGTKHGPLVEYLRNRGLVVQIRNRSSFSALEGALQKKIPPMVRFVEPGDEEEHFALVIGLTDTRIHLNDPWNGKGFSMSRADFLKRWTDAKKKYVRWMLLARPR